MSRLHIPPFLFWPALVAVLVGYAWFAIRICTGPVPSPTLDLPSHRQGAIFGTRHHLASVSTSTPCPRPVGVNPCSNPPAVPKCYIPLAMENCNYCHYTRRTA